jgi:LCP family protein required for cell wall assembly
MACAGGIVAIVVLVAGGGFLLANHLLSSIHRIPDVTALTAADQPVMPAATRRSMTVLLTGSATEPSSRGGSGTDGASTAPEGQSGLIALIHLNANGHGGAVVSIPPNTLVSVPGHGKTELWNALALGGPSLLIQTVEQLTDVRINHYSVLDFQGVRQVIGALHGVNVTVPYTTTSLGYTFHKGTDHLNAADVLAYVRQPSDSELGRELLEQNLIRAILDAIAHQHLFGHITTDYHVLHAMTGALSVDSNFSNGELESLALRLGSLNSGAGTFVSAPVVGGSVIAGGDSPVRLNWVLSRKLWRAIRNDAVAAFALRYPQTVTPGAPG